MMVDHFLVGKVNYMNHREASLQLSLHVNTVQHSYTINKSSLQVGKLELVTTGNITEQKDGNKILLTIQSERAGLKELLSLLPKEYTKKIDQFTFNGKINFKATVNGLIAKLKSPLIKAEFSSDNTSLKPINSDFILKQIRFKGFYTNRKSDSNPISYLSISQVSATLENQPLSGNISVNNLANPMVNGNIAGTINLKTLSAFYKPDTIASMSGNAKINLQFEGQPGNAAAYTSSGTMNMQHVSFTIKEKAAVFEEFNGLFAFDGNRFKINNLTGHAAGSDFKINGSIDNFFSFFFQKNQVLTGRAELSSRNIDLDELLDDKRQGFSNDTSYFLNINEHFNVMLDVNIGIISFRKFQAWNLKGKLAVHNKMIAADNLTFKSMNGLFELAGTIDARSSKNVLINCNTTVTKIDINQLFSEMGNFGQNIIKDKNVYGLLTADVKFSSVWSKTLHCDMDKIEATSNFIIEKGELINFEPMMALARYLKGADLQDIKFATLKNSIYIKQQKIFFPSMEIKSTALEMTASGTHTFDNIVDYRIQFLLSQIMGRKVKQMNTEFGTIEDDGLSRTKLFLTVKGPMSSPKINVDHHRVEEKIVTDINKEKKQFKNILNKEFGWFKKDSSAVKNTPKKKKEELQIERGDNE